MSRRVIGANLKTAHAVHKTSEKSVNTGEELLLCGKCREKISSGTPSGQKVMLKEYLKSIEYINSCHSLLNQIVAKHELRNSFTLPDIPNFVNVFSIVYNQFGKDGDKQQRNELDNIESLDEIYSRIDSLDAEEDFNVQRTLERIQDVDFHARCNYGSNIPRPVSSDRGRRSREEKGRKQSVAKGNENGISEKNKSCEGKGSFISDKIRKEEKLIDEGLDKGKNFIEKIKNDENFSEEKSFGNNNNESNEKNSNEENGGKFSENITSDGGVFSEAVRRNSKSDAEGNLLSRLNRQRIIRHENKAVLLERNKNKFAGEISEEDLNRYAEELLRSRSESPSSPRSVSSNSRSPSPISAIRTRKPSSSKRENAPKQNLKGNPPKHTYKLQQKVSPTINQRPGRQQETIKAKDTGSEVKKEGNPKQRDETTLRENPKLSDAEISRKEESDGDNTLTTPSLKRLREIENSPEAENQNPRSENPEFEIEASARQHLNQFNTDESPCLEQNEQGYFTDNKSNSGNENDNLGYGKKQQQQQNFGETPLVAEKSPVIPQPLDKLDYEKQKRYLSEKLAELERNQLELVPNLNLGVKQSKHKQQVLKQKFIEDMKRQLFPESSDDLDTDGDVKTSNLMESDDNGDNEEILEKRSLNSNRSSKPDQLTGVNNTYNLLKMSVSRPLRTKSVLSNIGILTNSGKIKPEKEQHLAKIKTSLAKDKQNVAFRQPRNRLREAQGADNKSRIRIGSNYSSPSSEIKSDDEEVRLHVAEGNVYRNKF